MAIERARFRVDTTPDTDSTSDLNGAISSTSATSVVVDDGTDFEVGQNIKVDSEEMTITAISTHTLTVVRGVNGTTAATHSDNVSVYEDDSPTYTPTQNPNIASEQPKEYDGVVARKSLGGTTFAVANHSNSRISRTLSYNNLSAANKDRLVALLDYAKGQLNTFQYSDDGNTWFTVRLKNNSLDISEVAYNAFNVDIEIEQQL
tara:strand:- start:7085 stop:7696 length:612 start_codon:yes stop_codon:yes gene_type:complete